MLFIELLKRMTPAMDDRVCFALRTIVRIWEHWVRGLRQPVD